MSSSDRFFPIVFMEALKEADREKIVFPYLAVTYWSQSNIEVMDIIKQNSDVILLFGGEEAVKAFKKEVAPKCEVLAFGPKVSFGVVTSDQSKEELAVAAKGFATDVVFWEQRACTACQNIFVERSSNSLERAASSGPAMPVVFATPVMDVCHAAAAWTEAARAVPRAIAAAAAIVMGLARVPKTVPRPPSPAVAVFVRNPRSFRCPLIPCIPDANPEPSRVARNAKSVSDINISKI